MGNCQSLHATWAALILAWPTAALTAEGQAAAWRWTSGLSGAVNGVAESHLFWDLPDGAAPAAGFDGSRQWLEWFVAPAVGVEGDLPGQWRIEGRASVLASGTWGSDAFAAGDTTRLGVEEAWLGIERRLGEGDNDRLQLRVGAQPLRIADGMLVSNGGSNGFERGALKLGPRKAWRDSALALWSQGPVTVQAFRLSPNEQDSNRTGTRLHGMDVRWTASPQWAMGGTWIEVADSRSPYPQAASAGNGPPIFLEGARGGLRVVHGWGQWDGQRNGDGRQFFARIDAARESHESIDLEAWAARFRGGLTWDGAWGRWTLAASRQAFSGDNPATPRLERFDPLYYDGSPSAWATGSKSAMVFINSNVVSTHLSLGLQPGGGRQITLRYARVAAMRLRSPLQFGQATRFVDAGGTGTVVSGVLQHHLSDDLFLEINQPLNKQWFLATGISVSRPGTGIRQVFPSSDPLWSGAYVSFFFAR